jgi:hypothetical protein
MITQGAAMKTSKKRRRSASKNREIACSPQDFAAFKERSRDTAEKIANFVGAENDGTGRVDFQRSKRLPGVYGYVVVFGDKVWLSVEGISSDAACAMLEALRFMETGGKSDVR